MSHHPKSSVHEDSSSWPSAYQQAYTYLRESVRDGRLKSGARIKAEDIAIELGVSRMPVREAIRQLDSEGLLTIRPNRGAVVTVLSSDEILELFEMRSVLEGLAIRRATEHFDEDAFAEIELILLRLERAQSDLDQCITRHNEFHDFICARGSGPRLFKEVQRLRTAVEPYLRLGLITPNAAGFAAEHRLLVEVIRLGDCEAAEKVMRGHVLSTAHDLIDFLAAKG